MKILFKNLYAEQILVILYREPNLWKKIVILTILISTFSDSHSLQAFQRELKSFCLSVELNI